VSNRQGEAPVASIQAELEPGAEQLRRVGALKALQRVMREIAATLDLDAILRVVLDEAIRFGDADAGVVVSFVDGLPEVRASQGYAETDLAALQSQLDGPRDDHTLPQWLVGEEAHCFHDVSAPGGVEVPQPNARAMLVMPVFYEQRLAASMMIQSARPGAFTPAVIEFAECLATQMSIAVGNAQRYQDQLRRGELMHQRAEQMSLLLEVSRTMRSDRPLDDILLDMAYAVQEGTGFDLVLISVLEGHLLRRVAGAGIPLTELEQRKRVRLRWERIRRLCQDRFRLGQCYYIPEQYRHLTEGIDVFVPEESAAVSGSGYWHTEDILFVPLRGNTGEIVGILSVDRPRNGLAPTAMTAEVLELFAAQVAQAIENHRLVDDLRRQVTTLQLFNELNRSITTKLDLPLVLNTVAQSVTNLLGYDYATVFLRDRNTQHFVPMASSGYALDLLEGAPLRVNAGFIADVVRSGLPLVVDDVAADPRFAGIGVPIGSSVAAPLTVEGQTVGILKADRKQAGDFSPAEVATLTALADQVTVAVENARLFEEVKRFNEELEARVADRTQELAEALERLRFQRDRSEVLYHIASELVASLDMDRVLSQALMLLQRAVRASRSSVILVDANTGELFYRAAIGHTHPIPPGGIPAPFRRDEGVVGRALEERRSIVVHDALEDDRVTPSATDAARSMLVVPVLGAGGESLGVILLESPLRGVFDEPQLQLVEAAAVQLGNALNNAELYRLIREQAERLGTMLRTQQIEAAKNQSILEGIADGVMVADASGHVTLFNAAAERILSITRGQALGRPQDEILGLYGSEAQAWLAQIEAWQQDVANCGADTFLAHRLEVGRRFVSVHLSPVVTGTHEFLGVVAVFRDITSEIEADRAKSDFVSTVSHELRTPMTSIVGYVDLMSSGAVGPLTEMQLSFLKKVKANADRLTNLVDDLLDISRIEQGRIELQLRAVAMEDIIAQVLDVIRPRTEEKGQVLETVLPPALPKCYGDPDRLTQILTNLVSNAHKYTPADGLITVYAYVRDGALHVAVADTGIGIAVENQAKIFERFYRVEDDPAVYEVSGTGLGLAITLSLIQMHGGSIWLESELGEGSIFTFSIPLDSDQPTQDVGDLPPALVTTAVPTVMVVEDDAEVAKLLKLTIEAEGMQVLTALSGEEALRMARDELPDFISLDIRLPDLNGLDVLQLLKRDPETADIPVVIVSVVSDRERALSLGAIEYLAKPLEARKLVQVVRRTLLQRVLVVVAGVPKESVDRLREILQGHGIGIRATMRGDRALRLCRGLQPALLALDLGLSGLDGYQLVDRLRRSQHTAGIPIIVTASPGAAAWGDTAQLENRLRALRGVQCLFEHPSVDELADAIFEVLGRPAGKESKHGQDTGC